MEPIQASCLASPETPQEIYNFCKKNKIYIIFDEIDSGLRNKKLCVFKKLNLTPDIVTFAKIFGGGLPMGICCINKNLNSKLNSLNEKVFFGGTFSPALFLGGIKYI